MTFKSYNVELVVQINNGLHQNDTYLFQRQNKNILQNLIFFPYFCCKIQMSRSGLLHFQRKYIFSEEQILKNIKPAFDNVQSCEINLDFNSLKLSILILF